MSAEPKQLELPVEPRQLSSKAKNAAGRRTYVDEVLPVFRAAIDRVTAKECHELFDVTPSSLSEANSGTSSRGREAHLEWLVQLLLWAPDAVKRELLTTLNMLAGYRAPEPRRQLSEADELRIYRMYADKVPGLSTEIEKAKESFR